MANSRFSGLLHGSSKNNTLTATPSAPPLERTEGVYASIFVNEQAEITSSQDYRVLYDYTAQVPFISFRSAEETTSRMFYVSVHSLTPRDLPPTANIEEM
ncbi:hypothetical protein EK904_007842 [Melospiza melodia maxima]|nr:hypothetical protein EK904_007842 [Melospiza melodia maxima]